MRFFLFWVACALSCAPLSPAISQTPSGPTVREVVEFRQILQPDNHSADALKQQVSPDGTRAFIVTRKADVANDRNRYEILLLHVAPDRLAEHRVPSPETVFAADVGDDGSSPFPAIQEVKWWDELNLVFLARLKGPMFQVYRLHLPTRELVQLTQESLPIVSFAAAKDMRRLVYAVQVPNPPLKDGARSVVVGNQSLWSVKFGQQSMSAQIRKYRFFVVDAGSGQPPRPLGEPFIEGNGAAPQVSISPDGRWALLPRYEPERTLAWSRQYPMLAEVIRKFGPGQRVDPLRYFSGPRVFKARRMVAWRLDDGREQAVVDAPDDALPMGGQDRDDRLWQGTGLSVVLAGTHLPLGASGRSSAASHVIEYWPDSGRWVVIAALTGRLDHAVPLADGFLVVDSGKRRRFQRLADGGWQELTGAPEPEQSAAWTLKVAESLNEPPDVVATSVAGRTVRLTRLNPQFEANSWGTMRPYAWRDALGQRWEGGLMAASGVQGTRRMPLVIQTYGFSPDRFYLDGPNRETGYSSAFAGRAFLREGLLVLAMKLRPVGAPFKDDWRARREFDEGVKGAIRALVKEGRVDPARVGIIGWSMTGERVLNLVTFSDMPIRAATIADGDENSLFSYTLTYGFSDSTWQHKEAANRGTPYGLTLPNWIASDPSLHTDCIQAALRIESYGPTVKNNWDTYALLRRQYKPVEMVVIPEGVHALSRPSERMISLQGNVDWFSYWLKGERRSNPVFSLETPTSLKAQYEAWDQMADMKRAGHKGARCLTPES